MCEICYKFKDNIITILSPEIDYIYLSSILLCAFRITLCCSSSFRDLVVLRNFKYIEKLKRKRIFQNNKTEIDKILQNYFNINYYRGTETVDICKYFNL